MMDPSGFFQRPSAFEAKLAFRGENERIWTKHAEAVSKLLRVVYKVPLNNVSKEEEGVDFYFRGAFHVGRIPGRGVDVADKLFSIKMKSGNEVFQVSKIEPITQYTQLTS